MIGLKFLTVGMRGFMPVRAHDDGRVPPPIPIVRDEALMLRQLQAEFAAVERRESTCCIVMVKPDAIEGGAEAGVMTAVGELFSRCLRQYDGLFVLGTGRYIVALPHIKEEDTANVMERLRGQVAAEPLPIAGNGAIAVTVSIGGAMVDPAVPLQDNIERADRALNAARTDGGNHVCLWSSGLDSA